MENPSRYAEQAYFHQGDTLWINLYIASELNWAQKGVILKQETAFPDSDTVRIVITTSQPKKLRLNFRHPSWCARPEVAVNGEPVPTDSKPSSYWTIEKEWRAGDVIALRFPMVPHVEPLPHTEGKILAMMYGPLQLVALVPSDPAAPDRARQRYSDHLKSPGRTRATPPVIVSPDIDTLLSAMKPEPSLGFGAFRVRDVLQPDYPLVPIHRVYEEHYAAYFPFYTAETWAEKQVEIRAAEAAEATIDAATLDRVEPGFQQSEVEHNFSSEKSETGDSFDRKWRDALPGGWFSYQMAVNPEKPVALVMTHWGGNRGRKHDIWIDDHHLSVELPDGQRFAFFDAAYAIPSEITKGRQTVTIRFASAGERSGTYGLKIIETQAVTAAQWPRAHRLKNPDRYPPHSFYMIKTLSPLSLLATPAILLLASQVPLPAQGDIPAANTKVKIEQVVTNGFTHPGIGLTKEALDRARAQVLAGKEPWATYYREMAQSANAARDIKCRNESPERPGQPDIDAFDSRSIQARLDQDGARAQTQALMYFFTGDDVYRANALRIIRVWAGMDPAKCQYYSDAHIHSGYPLKALLSAAEIIRYTTTDNPSLKWTDEDTRRLTDNLINPMIAKLMYSNGWFMNQNNFAIHGAMAGFIFTNNRTGYDQRVEWFTINKEAPNPGWDGSIKQLARLVETNDMTGEKVARPRCNSWSSAAMERMPPRISTYSSTFQR